MEKNKSEIFEGRRSASESAAYLIISLPLIFYGWLMLTTTIWGLIVLGLGIIFLVAAFSPKKRKQIKVRKERIIYKLLSLPFLAFGSFFLYISWGYRENIWLAILILGIGLALFFVKVKE